MATHWAIAIGINQYQHLPPLRYARQDARALRNFLVNEARLPVNHCWLFSDAVKTATDQEGLAEPQAILTCLQQLVHQVQADDRVWFFFCGYGLCQDQTDYLVPIAGDPTQLADTAIPVRLLLENLAALPTQQVLLLLDFSRNEGPIAPAPSLGTQTAALAGELGLAALLSCCPGQVAHEVANVGHGLFTEALLEGLRLPPPLTLQTLDQYLRDRLPDLCRAHRQPLQNPSVIVPPNRFSQVILERNGQLPQFLATDPDLPDWQVPAPLFDRSSTAPTLPEDPLLPPKTITLPPNPASQTVSTPPAPQDSRWPSPPWDPLDAMKASPRRPGTPPTSNPELSIPPSPPTPMPSESLTNPTHADEPPPVADDRAFWGRVLLWGGAAVWLLGLGILSRHWVALNLPTDPLKVPPPTPPTTPEPAKAAANPTPAASPPTLDVQAQRHTNQIVLTAAEGLIAQAPYQASSYSKAIALASKIQPGEPLYQEAQIAMEAWSREIMTIAQERATWGNRQQAIAAARLVPPSQTQVYQEAQAAIARWQ